jgi:hypothetical protein
LRNKWFENQAYRETDTFKDQKHRIGTAIDGQGIIILFSTIKLTKSYHLFL